MMKRTALGKVNDERTRSYFGRQTRRVALDGPRDSNGERDFDVFFGRRSETIARGRQGHTIEFIIGIIGRYLTW